MSFVTEVITPIIQTIAYVFMVGGILFFIYYGLSKVFPKIKRWFKYSLFHRRPSEEKLKFCIQAQERKAKEIDIKKAMLLSGSSFKEIDEILYIYRNLDYFLNSGKGGKKKNGK